MTFQKLKAIYWKAHAEHIVQKMSETGKPVTDAAFDFAVAAGEAGIRAVAEAALEDAAVLCDAVREASKKAYETGVPCEKGNPQIKGEWEASRLLAQQIRALKAPLAL